MLCAALTACGTPQKPVIEYRLEKVLPDASLVQDCDTSERDVPTNGDLANELSITRQQRDACSRQVKGLKMWRDETAKR